MKGLLVDFGGVLTTNVFDSFKAFCEKEGLDPDAVRRLFREDPRALAELRRLERGELTEEEVHHLVRGIADGSVSDAQIGALAMATPLVREAGGLASLPDAIADVDRKTSAIEHPTISSPPTSSPQRMLLSSMNAANSSDIGLRGVDPATLGESIKRRQRLADAGVDVGPHHVTW